MTLQELGGVLASLVPKRSSGGTTSADGETKKYVSMRRNKKPKK